MKTALAAWFGYVMPFDARLACIRAAGFDGVMLAWEDEMAPYAKTRFACAEAARAAGLEIVSAHGPYTGYNALWQSGAARDRVIAVLQESIRECAALGIPAFVVHTNDIDLNHPDIPAGLSAFETLAETAQACGTALAVENVARQPLLRAVLDHVGAAGLCYDSSHDFLMPCGRGKILSDYAHRLCALHLSDNDLNRDRHWLPGDGAIDYSRIVPHIARSGCKSIALEAVGDARRETAEQFAGRAWRAAHTLAQAVAAFSLGAARDV